MENSKFQDLLKSVHLDKDTISTNARIRYLPDESGEYVPYELLCFPSATFIPPGWESSDKGSKRNREQDFFEAVEDTEFSRKENQRKSFNRARNMLFNLAMSTTIFDCFVTLTFSSEYVNRYDYNEIIKKLNTWFDNRVRRNGLVYVFVPELHKDGAVHFHGLCNFSALKTIRACSPYTGKPLFDDEGRPIYNLSDFRLGITTVIPLSGENARVATTKYVYKYMTKLEGKKIGGRYYLSGGELGRPKYKYLNVDYESIPCDEISVGGIISVKKLRLNGDLTVLGL